jgi:hypothetical protein
MPSLFFFNILKKSDRVFSSILPSFLFFIHPAESPTFYGWGEKEDVHFLLSGGAKPRLF